MAPVNPHSFSEGVFYGGDINAPLPNCTIPQFMFDPAYAHPLRPKQGDVPCMIEDATGKRVSLTETRDRTAAMASVLKNKYKIRSGDTVMVCSPNDIDYPVSVWAITALGAVFSGANPAYTPSEIEHQLKITETKLIIAHSGTLEAALAAAKRVGLPTNRITIMDEAPKAPVESFKTLISGVLARGRVDLAKIGYKLKPNEGKTKVAMLCMSSGTTGPPKAVAISHSAIISNIVQMSAIGRLEDSILLPGDVVLGVLPFFHVAGLVFNLHFMIFSATTLVVVPKFDFMAMLESIVRYRIQHLMIVPPIALAIAKHPAVRKYDLSSLKFIGSGAAPLTSELQEMLKVVLPNVRSGQAYGLTETATLVSMSPFHVQCTFGSVGFLLPGVHAKVVKPDGKLAGYDEPGELVVKSPSVALGYHKNKKATEESFSADGWFRTGDQVVMKKNGEMWVTDRLKELIKVRGFQVSPAELEGLILDHPDVTDACVVGVPDERSGEVPLAFVVLTPDAEKRAKTLEGAAAIKASVQKLVADNKIRYKHLATVEFIPAIPKNASGKILRRILTEQVRAQAKAKAKL
ncbi:hypothetical protein HMN09_01259000 [Mycena chlorophos]|uniref:Acetyl-CoA synthetase-like protein n=1 Tax=Mycena chlorophos TaxID=658473 RepID=A0A8H6VRT6_MYCCL|nr:hypothetical protein HMN09_01259000 [Mycena chlorophos]